MLALRDYHKPLIAGTVTTLAAFLPMFMLPGIMGKYLSYIPITVFCTLLAALFLALTINSAIFLKLTRPHKHYDASHDGEFNNQTPEDAELLAQDREHKEPLSVEKQSFRERFFEKFSSLYV